MGRASSAGSLNSHAMQINKFKYYTIDIQKSLASQLSGKHILEFPVFLVLLPDEAKDYPLVGQESTTGKY